MRICTKCGEHKPLMEFRPHMRKCRRCEDANDTKLCPKCGRELSTSDFTRNRSKRSGLNSWCKKCSSEARGYRPQDYVPAYSLTDLRYRPAEQLLEELTLRQLSAALGMCRDTLAPMKRDPSACVDTAIEWDDEKVAKVRAWIDRQVA